MYNPEESSSGIFGYTADGVASENSTSAAAQMPCSAPATIRVRHLTVCISNSSRVDGEHKSTSRRTSDSEKRSQLDQRPTAALLFRSKRVMDWKGEVLRGRWKSIESLLRPGAFRVPSEQCSVRVYVDPHCRYDGEVLLCHRNATVSKQNETSEVCTCARTEERVEPKTGLQPTSSESCHTTHLDFVGMTSTAVTKMDLMHLDKEG